MGRALTHARETEARDMVRTKIDSFFPNGDALFREWSERDYGIDAVVELFDNGRPTGKIAYIQLKGTGSKINPLKSGDVVSCSSLSATSLDYARQDRIPFMLIYASTSNPKCFYYIDLQSQVEEIDANKSNDDQQKFTVHIPVGNYVEDDLQGFFDLIESYY